MVIFWVWFIKVVLAFLNSSIFQFLFQKKFSTIKVLRGDLEQLPFPIIDIDTHDKLESLVNKTLEGNDCQNLIDDIVFTIFNCCSDENLYIKESA